jgi:hypothetical protein
VIEVELLAEEGRATVEVTALQAARMAHARAVEAKDPRSVADAARRIWGILGQERRYAWLHGPAGVR